MLRYVYIYIEIQISRIGGIVLQIGKNTVFLSVMNYAQGTPRDPYVQGNMLACWADATAGW